MSAYDIWHNGDGDDMKKNELLQKYKKKYEMEQILGDEILENVNLHHFKKGEYIMHAGERQTYIFFLVKGKAKTGHLTQNGTVILNSFMYPLEIMGEVEVFHEQIILNDVVALSDVDCLSISVLHQYEALKKDTKFLYYLSYIISKKLEISNQNASISLAYPVENRLASYIVASETEGVFSENQQETSQWIGCSYRQLQRVLQKFCKLGYLSKVGKGKYFIENREQLQIIGQDIYVVLRKTIMF